MDQTAITSLASNPWLTLGASIFGIVSFFLSVVFYFKAKKDRIPCYGCSSRVIIEGVDKALDGLQLFYREKPQSRVTITKIIFWNEGRETIRKDDLAALEPLRMVFPEGVDILDAKITKFSSSANEVVFGRHFELGGENCCSIELDYLDHRDYFIIQIVHNGGNMHPFKIAGKIKGVSKILEVFSERLDPQTLEVIPWLSGRRYMKYSGVVFYLTLSTYGLWKIIHGVADWYFWVMVVFGVCGAWVLYSTYRIIPPVRI